MSKLPFLRLMIKHIIKPLTPFFKAWGHGCGSCLFHGAYFDVKALLSLHHNLFLSLLLPKSRYLHLLGLLVSEYEEIHYPIDDIFGVALLKALMEDLNLREKDLVPIFQTESNVSEILSGKQELTLSNIEQLAEFFHISPAAFLSKGK